MRALFKYDLMLYRKRIILLNIPAFLIAALYYWWLFTEFNYHIGSLDITEYAVYSFFKNAIDLYAVLLPWFLYLFISLLSLFGTRAISDSFQTGWNMTGRVLPVSTRTVIIEKILFAMYYGLFYFLFVFVMHIALLLRLNSLTPEIIIMDILFYIAFSTIPVALCGLLCLRYRFTIALFTIALLLFAVGFLFENVFRNVLRINITKITFDPIITIAVLAATGVALLIALYMVMNSSQKKILKGAKK